jgi:pimeloyl-ACP methyl ester carboxylesterase
VTLRHRTLRGYDVASFELWRGVPAPTDPAGQEGDVDRAVVLVHGIGVSSRYFAPLERDLSAHATVLAPDLPGFGRSPRQDEPLAVEEHAEVLAALIEQTGLRRPLVVGHSMGVQFVTELAVRRPDLVGAVVLMSPVTDPAARSAWRQAFRLTLDVFREPWHGSLLQFREWLRTGVRWYLRTLVPHMRDYPLEHRIQDLTVPVTLVRGTQDPVAPSGYVRSLAVRAQDARLVEVPGTAHLVMYERPDVIAALCRGLLDRRAV